MKRKILSAIAAAGLTTCAFGQYILLDNAYIANYGSGGPTATSYGSVYTLAPGGTPTLFDGTQYDLGVTVFGGPNLGQLSLMGTYTPANDPKGYTGLDYGTFGLGLIGAQVDVPGVVSGGPASFELQMWLYNGPYATGTFQSYAAAFAGLDPTAIVTFEQPYTGSTTVVPPRPAPDLTGMPSVVILVPEPTSFVLAGLGLTSLLAFHRRK